jgi:hypothetical protein
MHARDDVEIPAIDGTAHRKRKAVRLVTAGCLFVLSTACASQRDDATTARTGAAALGIEGGVESGPTGAPSADTTTAHKLDDQERMRLGDAARQAFGSLEGATTAYTVVPWNIDAEPTAVSATPVGPVETRTAGSCRPIGLSATKGGRTTTGILTFCRAPGSNDLQVSGKV